MLVEELRLISLRGWGLVQDGEVGFICALLHFNFSPMGLFDGSRGLGHGDPLLSLPFI